MGNQFDAYDIGRTLSKFNSMEDSVFKKHFDKAGYGFSNTSSELSISSGAPSVGNPLTPK